jgi:N-acetylmuramoyl-L-alanine amidase
VKKLPGIFLLLLLNICCFGQRRDVQDKIKYYTEKAQNYLDKEKALSGYYSINEKGVTIYASPQDKKNNIAEFHLEWNYAETFKQAAASHSWIDIKTRFFKKSEFTPPAGYYMDGVYYKPKSEPKPLDNLRIAIDPGHIAGEHATGDLEKKHIKIKADSLNGIKDSIEISEGILTFATAELLKEKLEKQGATVFFTRTADKTAFGKTFGQWKKDDLKKAVDSLYKIGELSGSQKQYFLGKKAKDRDIFRVVFRDLELAKRVELINQFHPDFTVIIHYNVDETNIDWEKCSEKNYNMTFVAGSFMKNDLSTKEKRFEFLRLLITDDLEKSISLSSAVVRNFESTLNVKTADIRDAKYLVEGCLPSGSSGVYCRNLQLPRYIHSPVVYGETLFQDNINECKALNEESDKKKNKRVQQVADAYYKGIMEYAASR